MPERRSKRSRPERTGMLITGFLMLSFLPCSHVPIASAAPAVDDVLSDVSLARDMDYCGWYFDKRGNIDGIPDLQAVSELDDASLSETQKSAVALVRAGIRIAASSKTAKACERRFARGRERYEKTYRKYAIGLQDVSIPQFATDPRLSEIQRKITDLWSRDQASRKTYIDLQTGDTTNDRYWARQLSAVFAKQVDLDATQYMRSTLDTIDWIDIQRFGSAVSARAWLLVQHADRDPEFQALALKRMAPYLETGGVDRANYAYLWDRVAVNNGRQQRFGTQPDWQCRNGKLELMPVEDPANLDARRAGMNLGPAADALAEMSRNTCL
jgi:hypothetical protein